MQNIYSKEIETRFWAKVQRADENSCWLWTAGTQSPGYGRFRIANKGNKSEYAHRVAYMLTTGIQLTKKDVLCHTCDNPPCCNPAHLIKGSHKTNAHDRDRKGRTAILRMHAKLGGLRSTSRLSNVDIFNIRCMYAAGITPTKIGHCFNVSRGCVWRIATKQSYGDYWISPFICREAAIPYATVPH